MTRLSRTFNRQIQLWESTKVADGFGGSTIQNSLVGNVWANVRDRVIRNYDNAGISQNKKEKLITVRYKDLNTNINFFVIDGQGYQINDYVENYKVNQFECFCEATNFEITETNTGFALFIGDNALFIGSNALIVN